MLHRPMTALLLLSLLAFSTSCAGSKTPPRVVDVVEKRVVATPPLGAKDRIPTPLPPVPTASSQAELMAYLADLWTASLENWQKLRALNEALWGPRDERPAE